LALTGAPLLRGAETLSAGELRAAASTALERGQYSNAVELAAQAIAAEPDNFRAWAIRGRANSLSKRPALAIADFTQSLKLEPSSTSLYQVRGEDYFRVGRFKESVADFDRYLELVPAQKPYHWQRGISLYYAGEFEEGRKQFELHQTVNAHDVENAVWHFLCTTRVSGLAKARAALIPIEGDARIPMSQVHGLFSGKLKVADVLKAARAGNPSAKELNNRLFYAHLYLGLYFEATGDSAASREHIFKAASEFNADHYMGDVARSHAAILRTRKN
jgi:lipoprotein NlpI